MSRVLVDANVLLDVLTDDPTWYAWSAARLDACVASGKLCINPIIYAEVSVGFDRIEALDEALPPAAFLRLPLPWEAGFLAGKAFMAYRKARGARTSPLPDFYIGAHAAIENLPLLTRDAARYRTYFPTPTSTSSFASTRIVTSVPAATASTTASTCGAWSTRSCGMSCSRTGAPKPSCGRLSFMPDQVAL